MGKVKGGEIKKKNAIKLKLTRQNYPAENVSLAVDDVDKGMSVAEASRKFDVPESTIRARRSGKYTNNKPGARPVFTEEEESELVQWIDCSSEKGNPVTKKLLTDCVEVICKKTNKPNRFTNHKPGRSWHTGFKNRNRDVVVRKPGKVSMRRAQVTLKSVRSWYLQIKTHLEGRGLLNISPERIWNCDEAGFSLNPTPTNVLATTGCKNVYKVVGANEKENVNVLMIVNAAGSIGPSSVLFKGENLPSQAAGAAPADFMFGCAPEGMMDSCNFYEYIVNGFDVYLTENNVEKPVVLYLDKHGSHLSLPLSKYCETHGIELIGLHSNTTHFTQPCDVGLFRPLKLKHAEVCEAFCRKALIPGLQKQQFAPVLKKTLNEMKFTPTLPNAFRRCAEPQSAPTNHGSSDQLSHYSLYPFNFDAIDKSKILNDDDDVCIQDKGDSNIEQSKKTLNATTIRKLQDFETFLTEDQLSAFKIHTGSQWHGITEDESLFNVWNGLRQPKEVKQVNSNKMPPDLEEDMNVVSLQEGEFFEIECGIFDITNVPTDATLVNVDQCNNLDLKSIHNAAEVKQLSFLNTGVEKINESLISKLGSASQNVNNLSPSSETSFHISQENFDIDHIQKPLNLCKKKLSVDSGLKNVNSNSTVLDLNKIGTFAPSLISNKLPLQESLNIIGVSIKKYLPYPNTNAVYKQKSNKRTITKVDNDYSVISGSAWQGREERKVKEKVDLENSSKLKRQTKLENAEKVRIEKERKQEKAVIKRKENMKKQHEKLLKQQVQLEVKEEKIRIRHEKEDIQNTIVHLQEKQLKLDCN
ncbi:hypothetical protein TKK_0003062 [Trichogramma kaykai]